jgi:hypothetical protein
MDELIQKYIDNELTRDEEILFREVYNSDLNFKKNVDNIKKIDNELGAIKTTLNLNDLAFIADFRNSKTTHTPNKRTLRKTGIRSAYTLLILLISSILTVVIYNFLSNDSINNLKYNKETRITNQSRSSEEISNEVSSSPSHSKQITRNEDIDKKTKEIASNNEHVEIQSKIKSDNPEANELNLKIQSEQNLKNLDYLNQLVNELELNKSRKDNIASANTSKRIGLIYLNTYKDIENGISFLNQSLMFAEESKVIILIADILTELGKVELKYGDKIKGREYILRAINLYSQENNEKQYKNKELID